MTVSITHAKVSSAPEGDDPNKVRTSDWNDEHVLEGTYAAWTPTLTADGGNPNLGSTGTATGRYIQIGKMIHAYGRIVFAGTGVTAGSGVYELALPVTASASGLIGSYGSTVLYDDSAGTFSFGMSYPLDADEFRIAVATTTLAVTNAHPWTWAANDQINFMLMYEAA